MSNVKYAALAITNQPLSLTYADGVVHETLFLKFPTIAQASLSSFCAAF